LIPQVLFEAVADEEASGKGLSEGRRIKVKNQAQD